MNELKLNHPPRRVVSLVPSLTESLFDLGMGEALVAISDYCIHPAGQLTGLPRIGGPKNPDIATILALAPDLVLANQEENTRHAVEQLESAGIPVWVSFPKTAHDAIEVLWQLIEAFQNVLSGFKVTMLERTLEWAEAAAETDSPVRVFCPIWQDTAAGETWWMTFNHDTYAHDVLRLSGGLNVFSGRERHYPLDADLGKVQPEDASGRDTRYPRVTVEEVCSLDPELILLPSEPFEFTERHAAQIEELLPDVTAVRDHRVVPVDGSLLTWHGTRLAIALRELPNVIRS